MNGNMSNFELTKFETKNGNLILNYRKSNNSANNDYQ